MRIRHLKIRNFRGIRELDWAIPDHRLFCLVGRGDSTKSTILEGLRRVFFPQWNLVFDDADFHLCNPANAISIEIVLGALPDDFKDLASYGHWLCGWDNNRLERTDDPGDDREDALRVRLSVGDDLEPAWSVIKNDNDAGVQFKATDRAKAAVSLIGAVSDRHLTWSRGSILSQLTETESITSSLAGAARAAKAALEARRAQDLRRFDEVAEAAETTARALGVNVAASYKAHLDADAINVRMAGLALHDGDMPLRQLGLGSKRMLTTGLQKQALRAPHITLFDEVEVGLEPHRIARLLQHLKADTTGQYFLTTHSLVVLRELTVIEAIASFVRNNSEGGKRAQAVVAGLLDVFAGPERVESGRINDPSRKYPGDVCVRLQGNPEVWEKALEVRDKPVTETDVRIFGKKCVDMGVREAAVMMASDAQPRLDAASLQAWAKGFGLGLTLFQGWPAFVEQALFWSELPKPVAARRAVPAIHERLVQVEASPEGVALWGKLTRSSD